METSPVTREQAPVISKNEQLLREAFVVIDQRIEERLESFGEITEVSVHGRLRPITNAFEKKIGEEQARLQAVKEVYEQVKGNNYFEEVAAAKFITNSEATIAKDISDAEVARYITKLPATPTANDEKYKVAA